MSRCWGVTVAAVLREWARTKSTPWAVVPTSAIVSNTAAHRAKSRTPALEWVVAPAG